MNNISLNELYKQYQLMHLDSLKEEHQNGWQASDVEAWKDKYSFTVKDLKSFRNNTLVNGPVNFPDRPIHHVGLDSNDVIDYGCLPRSQFLRATAILYRQFFRALNRLPAYKWAEYIDLAQEQGGFAARTFNLPFMGKVSEASLRYAYYASKLKKHAHFNNIIEIGGGFGGLCEKLYKVACPNKYILTDLPLNMALTYLWLSSHYHNQVGVVWHKDNMHELEKPIVIVAPWLLNDLDLNIDLAINTASFQHMDEQNLVYYTSVMQKLKIAKIYSINRTIKRDPTDVLPEDYPFKPNFVSVDSMGGFLGKYYIEEWMLRKP